MVLDQEVKGITVKYTGPESYEYGQDIDKTKIVVKELKMSGAEGRDVTKLAEITLQSNEVGKQKIVVTYGEWTEYIDIQFLLCKYLVNYYMFVHLLT